MTKSILITLVLSCCLSTVAAQTDSISGNYRLKGVLKDRTAAVIAGASVYVSKAGENRSFATDANGDFDIGLQPGEYEITVNPTNAPDFKAFLKIQDGGLNPNDLVFIVDPRTVCCSNTDGIAFPKPVSLPKPPFPAAARAVRAQGEVIIAVTIGDDGKVIAAKAESGHPLLRAAAQLAARSSKFESSEQGAERDARLTYVFLADIEKKPGLDRYHDPYRIVVISNSVFVDTTDVDPGNHRSLALRLRRFFGLR
jgi:TonB family protein